MPKYVSWITSELARQFPGADLTQGVDLNRDGKLKKSERICDFDKNGVVGDWGDWRVFLKKNETQIRFLGGIFKWSAPFKPDNPINDLLAIESEMVSPAAVQSAYEKLADILSKVKERLAKSDNLTPQERLKIVYDVMRSMGIRLKQQDSELFIENLKTNTLDCDTSSLVVLAVAHEMGWPVYLVTAPRHAFVRWDDRTGTRFNMDNGETHPDSFYITKYNILDVSLKKGCYLINSDDKKYLSFFLTNRGYAKFGLGDYRGAIKDCDEALRLNPNYPDAYNNRGAAKSELGDYKGAIKDHDEALRLNPNDPADYNNRSNAKKKLGDYKGADEDFKMSERLQFKLRDE